MELSTVLSLMVCVVFVLVFCHQHKTLFIIKEKINKMRNKN